MWPSRPGEQAFVWQTLRVHSSGAGGLRLGLRAHAGSCSWPSTEGWTSAAPASYLV